MGEFFRRNKSVLLLSGVLILFALIIAFFSFRSLFGKTYYSILFSLFIALPLYFASTVIDSLAYRNFVGYPTYNYTNWAVMIVGFILNVLYVFYLSKLLLFLKNKMNLKLFIAIILVLLFFLLGLDYQIVKKFDYPDLSCTNDFDCISDFNQYSGGWCDYSCHSSKWTYYEPLMLRVFATTMEPCGSSPPCGCVKNKCQFTSTSFFESVKKCEDEQVQAKKDVCYFTLTRQTRMRYCDKIVDTKLRQECSKPNPRWKSP